MRIPALTDSRKAHSVSTSGSVPTPAKAVLDALTDGATVSAAAVACGVSEVFVRTMAEHFSRLGLLGDARSLCSSGLGACTPGVVSDEARVHCAGCPLSLRRKVT